MTDGADSAADSQDAASTETSTPTDDLGSAIVSSIESSKPATEVEKLTSMVENLKVSLGRQSAELGQFRATAAAAVPVNADATASKEDLSELVYSDPEGFAKAIAAQVEAKVQAKIAPVVAPVEQQNVVNTVRAGNPLADRLLNDPATGEYLTDLSNNPDAMASFEDVKRLRLEAALFRRIGGLYSQQEEDRAKPPIPPRPESAGAADPDNSSTSGDSDKSITDTPKNLAEGVEAFTHGMEEAGHKRRV